MFFERFKRIVRFLLRRRYFNRTVVMRGEDNARQGLLDLIDWIGKRLTIKDSAGTSEGITMIEIGSYQGESAKIFLDSGVVKRLYCIDPWQMNYDKNDVAAFTDMSRIEHMFDSRVGADPRIVKVKGTIDTFMDLWHKIGAAIDVVYVDGCHTYEAVKYDLQVTLAKIQPRVVCGHDFTDAWPGSKRAVAEVVGMPDATFVDTSWVKVLKSGPTL